MLIRQHTSTGRKESGYTLFELLEVIAAIALGGWLADVASRHFEGTWRTIVLWTIRTVGSGIIFLCLFYGVSYLLNHLEKRKISKGAKEENKHNAD